MDNRVLLAEGREAEVYIQSDGTVLKLMRNAVDIARAQREATVCRLLEQQGMSPRRSTTSSRWAIGPDL